MSNDYSKLRELAQALPAWTETITSLIEQLEASEVRIAELESEFAFVMTQSDGFIKQIKELERMQELNLKIKQAMFERFTRAEAELTAIRGDQQPVGWISERNLAALGRQFSVRIKHEPVMVRPVALYTHPQPAVLPPDVDLFTAGMRVSEMQLGTLTGVYMQAWSDCIAAAKALGAKPVPTGLMMQPHEFSRMVNALRDVPPVQSKRESIVSVLRAFNIKPAGGEVKS